MIYDTFHNQFDSDILAKKLKRNSVRLDMAIRPNWANETTVRTQQANLRKLPSWLLCLTEAGFALGRGADSVAAGRNADDPVRLHVVPRQCD
jgi:hypothetical protein